MGAIPEIGSHKALLVACARPLGWLCFVRDTPEKFKKYRQALQRDERAFDLELELTMTGTTFIHVASVLLQSFGLGRAQGEDLTFALLHVPRPEDSSSLLGYRVAQDWIDSLLITGKPPSSELGDELNVNEKAIDELLGTLSDEQNEGTWLTCTKDDIGPAKTPQLRFNYDLLKVGSSSSETDEVSLSEEDQS